MIFLKKIVLIFLKKPAFNLCNFFFKKQDSFFLVGGTAEPEDDPESFHRDILRYDPDSEQWVEMDQKLQNPDFVRVALFSSEVSMPCFAEGEEG